MVPTVLLGMFLPRLDHRASHANHLSARSTSTSSPVLATIRIPRATVVQMIPDEPTRQVLLMIQESTPGHHTLDSIQVRNGTTGAQAHSASLGRDLTIGTSLVDPEMGRLYILAGASSDSSGFLTGTPTIHVIDGTTGSTTRTFPAGLRPASLAVDSVHHRLFILNEPPVDSGGSPVGDAVVRTLDLTTGKLLRMLHVANFKFGDQILVDEQAGSLYVPDELGIRVLDEQTDTTRSIVSRAPIGYDVAGTFYSTAPVALDRRAGLLFISFSSSNRTTSDGGIYIVDARSGRVLHTVHGVGSDTVAVDERADRFVGVFNDTKGSAQSAPTPYISLDTVDIRRGSLVQSTEVPPYPADVEQDLGVDEKTGRTIVVTSDDTSKPSTNVVSVFDTRSGRLLRSGLMLGIGGPSVGTMTREGRVFVLNAGDNTVSVLDAARL